MSVIDVKHYKRAKIKLGWASIHTPIKRNKRRETIFKFPFEQNVKLMKEESSCKNTTL